jgi:hypothetical protein
MIRKIVLFLPLIASLRGQEIAAQQSEPASQGPRETQTPAQEAKPAQAPAQAGAEDAADTVDGAASISLDYWLTNFKPAMRTGRLATAGTSADLDFPGNGRQTPGIVVSLPAGKGNTLRFSYFRTQGNGNLDAPHDITLFGTAFTAGELLNTSYKLQNVKVSWNFLSWPFPPEGSTLRIKTLWEVQYTTIRSTIDAPLAEGTTDTTTGLTTFPTVVHSNSLIYPSFGLGVEKFFSKSVRWEGQASGFALPHLPSLWDAETFFAFRRGRFEIRAGAKGFHFKTPQRQEQYVLGTAAGGCVGLTFYP